MLKKTVRWTTEQGTECNSLELAHKNDVKERHLDNLSEAISVINETSLSGGGYFVIMDVFLTYKDELLDFLSDYVSSPKVVD